MSLEHQGPDSIQRCCLTSIENPIMEIRQSSYLHNGISYTCKTISLYCNWMSPQSPVDEIWWCLLFKWVALTWLKERPKNKMAAVLLTPFSNAFHRKKNDVFLLEFHWSLSKKVWLKMCQRWFRKWQGAIRHQALTWTNDDQVMWCHVMSVGHNELIGW